MPIETRCVLDASVYQQIAVIARAIFSHQPYHRAATNKDLQGNTKLVMDIMSSRYAVALVLSHS